MRTTTSRIAALISMLTLGTLAGCQTTHPADYGVDVVNRTPQPVFVQIFKKGTTASTGVSKRLGPGDRVYVGSVRSDPASGAYVAVDTLSNPNRPITMDLQPGTAFLEIQQDGENANSPLRIIDKH